MLEPRCTISIFIQVLALFHRVQVLTQSHVATPQKNATRVANGGDTCMANMATGPIENEVINVLYNYASLP